MFGYVLPPAGMAREDRERFRQTYCGLCHALSIRYGAAARWILNYDSTFLAVLLSCGQEGDAGASRCPRHPLRRRPCRAMDPVLGLAADECVILTWWKLRDGVEDHAFPLPWEAASALLRPAAERAARARPVFEAEVRRRLDDLRELERARCPSIDRPADAFASLLRAAAGEAGIRDPAARRPLEQVLYHLGRWIYLIDAADDLREDARAGRYNAAALRWGLSDGVLTPEARGELALSLDWSLRSMAAAFELLDTGPWRPLLEATIYQGLPQVGRAVLDGTFRRIRRHPGAG